MSAQPTELPNPIIIIFCLLHILKKNNITTNIIFMDLVIDLNMLDIKYNITKFEKKMQREKQII